MIERGRNTEAAQHPETILSQAVVEEILETARENLRRDGLMATLFYQLENGERGLVPLPLPAEHSAKQMYFAMLGVSLKEVGLYVGEAILVSESWVILASKSENLDVSPSQHPDRREAITLIGRDASNSNFIFAIQPFQRDDQNQPVFEPAEINQIDGSLDSDLYATGLLDFLFSAQNAA